MLKSSSDRLNYTLPNEQRLKIDEIVDRYGGVRDPILKVLIEVQTCLGYLSKPSILHIAERLDLNPGKVYSVATFYSLLKTRAVGKRVIRVCDSPPCHVMDSGSILDALREELGIEVGENTEDGEFSLEAVGCLGLCSVGPAMMVDDDLYGNLTRDKVREVIKYYKDKKVSAI